MNDDHWVNLLAWKFQAREGLLEILLETRLSFREGVHWWAHFWIRKFSLKCRVLMPSFSRLHECWWGCLWATINLGELIFYNRSNHPEWFRQESEVSEYWIRNDSRESWTFCSVHPTRSTEFFVGSDSDLTNSPKERQPREPSSFKSRKKRRL